MAAKRLEVNGTGYRWPDRPIVVVCIDGGDPAYIEHGLAAGIIPNVERYMREGFHTVAHGTMPSFTCPNNMSIVTGRPASVHGISGNFYLDRATGEPVVMTGPELLKVHSVMSEFSCHGARVVSVTAKDKLRRQLQKGMELSNGSVSFSSQYADRCTMEENGIEDALAFVDRPLPDMYSADLSLFVLDAGLRLLEERRPDILYLSLTDYIQHAYPPGHPEADRFYEDLDAHFGRFEALGATVALTADHGMNEKTNDDGTPRVVWLQDLLDEEFGEGAGTVICPITDAFVGHHGALGGFVRVYCHAGLSGERVADRIREVPGLERVLARGRGAGARSALRSRGRRGGARGRPHRHRRPRDGSRSERAPGPAAPHPRQPPRGRRADHPQPSGQRRVRAPRRWRKSKRLHVARIEVDPGAGLQRMDGDAGEDECIHHCAPADHCAFSDG